MKKFATLWWITLLIKSLIAIYVPLSNDEAYYWVWGHHPQLSYFDHPPMVGWLFSVGTVFESFHSAARLPGVWLGHVTLLVWNRILSPYLDENRRKAWLLFVCLSPFMGLGSLIITPDVPLVFFWSLSLWILMRAVEAPSLQKYSALGISLGLGFCSKYMIVLFVPTCLFWLAMSGSWRRVRWVFLPATILLGLLACAPVIYWNWQHDWASFAFQMHHGLSSMTPSLSWPIDYALGQIAILFPTVVWLSLQGREPKELHVLRYFAWIPVVFFFCTSFKARVEANWPIMAHPAFLALAVCNARSFRPLKITAGIWAVALLVVLSQVAHPWIPIDPNRLKTSELTEFDSLTPEVAKLYESELAKNSSTGATSSQAPQHGAAEIYFGSYQMAAAVSFQMKHQFYKLAGLTRTDFYDFQPQSRPNGDRFWFCGYDHQDLPGWAHELGYSTVSSRKAGTEFVIYEVERSAKDSHR